ncbi:hypothetical protein yc1106_09578 [Curvularia clavata]|uniref:Uncharacterized protein n=1 Tax=Curvularia clavata TaxID=95742 RepID=A0A9Q8ZGL0_CURCL|nr:hypothetical protein yc1106_09578 [Curvularia clavata]
MESGPNRSAHACDCKNFRYNMSQAIYGSFPSCAADSTPSQTPRAKSPHKASKAPSTPRITVPVDITVCCQETTINSTESDSTTPTWLPYQRILPGGVEKMDNIHQSVCLNLTPPCAKASTADSELWIMPELDDCESGSSSSASSTPSRCSSSSSSPPARQYSFALSDATKAKAKFHLDQLRARLVQADCDAWDFFMARCNDDKRRNEALQHKHQSEERLDEEFDLVVLSAVPASC